VVVREEVGKKEKKEEKEEKKDNFFVFCLINCSKFHSNSLLVRVISSLFSSSNSQDF